MITGNTHFAIATHVLTVLAFHDGSAITSSDLAKSVDTNPAFLRSVLGRLREAGLVETRLGKGGGALLARPARSISLLDVYRATEGNAEVKCHDCSSSPCFIADGIVGMLTELGERLDAALARELGGVMVSDVVKGIPSP